MSRRLVVVLVALIACDSKSGGGGGGSTAKLAESGTQRGSAGGFSAQMSAELAKAGIGEAYVPPAAPATNTPASTAPAGSASTAPAPAPAPSPAPAPASSAAAAPSPSAAPSGSGVTAQPITDDAPPAKAMTAAVKADASRRYVQPSAEIAAIKFELEPNWERDVGEAGTFSLVVRVPNTDDSRVFSVRYGYEDQSAPVDCDSYKKFLEDRRAMKVSVNRQRGAACYVEGVDQAGVSAFRILLTYGGKRLMCHGSLYKDVGSLGDLRDKVLMQAKKICETLAL